MAFPKSLRPVALVVFAIVANTAGFAAQSEMSVRVAPDAEYDPLALDAFDAELAAAQADEIYYAKLEFEQPVPVADLQADALRLGLSRILATVEYPHPTAMGHVNRAMLSIGDLYGDEKTWRFTVCRARIQNSSGIKDALSDLPVESWGVSAAFVHAPAHALREFLTRPPVRLHVIEGRPANARSIATFIRNIEQQQSQPITFTGRLTLPDECQDLAAPLPAPILTTTVDEQISSIQGMAGEDFRSYATRVLSMLDPDSAVTIQLKLAEQVRAEELALLVSQYRIDGMQAELVPKISDRRVMLDAELSIHGADLDEQVNRINCRIGSIDHPDSKKPWIADWITVSLRHQHALSLMSYPFLAQARVAGVFPASDLERLAAYHRQAAEKRYPVTPGQRVPDDCNLFFER